MEKKGNNPAELRPLKHPYGFDLFKEFKIYLSVGDKDGIKEGYLYYSDWRNHIRDDCLESMLNREPNVNKAEFLENFSRYLKQKQMPYKMLKDLSISLIAPIEIAWVTVFATIEYFGSIGEAAIILFLINLAFMVMIILAHGYGTLWSNFYSDILEIVEEERTKGDVDRQGEISVNA